ncbi:MAG: cyclic nucleotide-binding domain-containing protein [Candidatus Eisenbacteria bacterium]|nr:cyclic nucleotide-binding domain-containing protein [Candidatus Latescibacterota bacterium]MBD3300933.1 cyclic nucleotide-binding domain-containing protein [Candidatus Eisenbacteria bacterium]
MAKPIDLITTLRQVPFFRDLDRSSLRELALSTRILSLERGADLFTEGDPCRGMFLVISGQVKIFRSALSGREQIMAIETPGAVVAELPLIDGEPYPASCSALADSEVLLVPREAFEDLLSRKPELAFGVMRLLGGRLRQLVRLVEDLSLLEVPQRLARYLLELSGRQGATFPLPLSNQEIAARLGTVREIVSRNLHRLAHEGAIAIDGRRITILDEERLRELAEEP